MPEQPHSLIDRIAHDLAAVNWPAPEEIRARARRRTARTAATACAALVLLAAASSLLVVNGRGAPQAPFAQPPTPTTPLILAIPPEALLQSEDMGVKVDRQEMFRDDNSVMPMDAMLDLCLSSKRLVLPKTAGFVRSESLLLHRTSEGDRKPSDFLLNQYVGRFTVDPERFVAEFRSAVAGCDGFNWRGPIQHDDGTIEVELRHRWTVIDEDTVGDQSLVLRHEARAYVQSTGEALGQSTGSLVGLVRVHDLVAIVVPKDSDPERLGQLLQRAAARLCVAANPRC